MFKAAFILLISGTIFVFPMQRIFASEPSKALRFPLEIQVDTLNSETGLKRYIEFSSKDGRECSDIVVDSKKTALSSAVCKEIISRLQTLLLKPAEISEYINPSGSYYQVRIKTPDTKWRRTVATIRIGHCKLDGKCVHATDPVAFQVAELLRKKIVANSQSH